MARRTRTGERARARRGGRRAGGFTYLFVLFLVALLGVGLAAAGEAWQSQRLRAAEAELLWTGDQYRRAINAYYRNAAGCGAERNRYPRELASLVKDPRCPATVRHLRKLYPDPVTDGEWELVRAPDGGIAGVRSPSTQRPFKVADFRVQDRDFENKKSYREWVFVDNTMATARGRQQVLPGVSEPVPGNAAPMPRSPTTDPGGMMQPMLGTRMQPMPGESPQGLSPGNAPGSPAASPPGSTSAQPSPGFGTSASPLLAQ